MFGWTVIRRPRRRPPGLHVLRIIVLLAAAVALTALSPAQAKAPTGKCRSAKGTILAQGPLAVAYKAPNTFDSTDLIGCVRRTGRKRYLAALSDSFDLARPVVHGTAVGYVTVTISDGAVAKDYTVINIDLLRRPEPKVGSILGQALEDNRAVGGLDITNRGAAAWVECPEQTNASDCGPGKDGPKRVMATNTRVSDAPVVQLGEGQTIDPRSVRIDHKNRAKQRVSWVQEGRRRSRPFPPATAP